jgi:hypothetical protein
VVAGLILLLVVTGFADDYLVIKKKDGVSQRIPLKFNPDQIESLHVEPGQPGAPAARDEEPPEATRQEEPESAPAAPMILRQGGQAPVKGLPQRTQEQDSAVDQGAKRIQPPPQERQKTEQPGAGPKKIEQAAMPSPGKGFSVNIYKLPDNIKALPDYSAFPPVGTTTCDRINLEPAKGENDPSGLPENMNGLGLRFVGMFMVSGEGIFKWRLQSKDGARLHIDDKTVIENDGVHESTSKTAYVHLAEGIHTVIIDGFNSQGAPLLKLFLQPPMGPEQIFSATAGAVGWKEPDKPYDVFWGQVYFVPKGNYPEGPDFSQLSPIGRLIVPELDISGTGGFVGLPGKKEMVGVRYQGFFNVQGAGIFAFRLVADSFARLTIGKQSIVETASSGKSEQSKLGWAFLQQGSYPVTVDYFNAQGDPKLQLFVTAPTKNEELFAPAEVLEGFSAESSELSLIPAFVYFVKPNTKTLPNYNKMTPAGMFFTKAIDYPINRGTREFPGVPKREDWLGLRFYVKFTLSDQEAGNYKFRLVCDDAARLIVGKKMVLNAEQLGRLQEVSGSVALPAGSHEMFLDYLQGTGPSALQLYITSPGGEEKVFAFQ